MVMILVNDMFVQLSLVKNFVFGHFQTGRFLNTIL